MKRLFFVFLSLLFLVQIAFAKDVTVNIRPFEVITTETPVLQEGDTVKFQTTKDVYVNSALYIKKGETAEGIVTSREENDFDAIVAKLCIEQFKTKNVKGEDVNLKGMVYKKGNDHRKIMDILFFNFIRGGEVWIKPEVDTFILYLEVK